MSKKFDVLIGVLFNIEDLLTDINNKLPEPKKVKKVRKNETTK